MFGINHNCHSLWQVCTLLLQDIVNTISSESASTQLHSGTLLCRAPLGLMVAAVSADALTAWGAGCLR
jgi:hypothetical protein